MLSPAIATFTLLGFRLRSFEEMADRLVAGNPYAWAQVIAIVVCILIGYRSSRR